MNFIGKALDSFGLPCVILYSFPHHSGQSMSNTVFFHLPPSSLTSSLFSYSPHSLSPLSPNIQHTTHWPLTRSFIHSLIHSLTQSLTHPGSGVCWWFSTTRQVDFEESIAFPYFATLLAYLVTSFTITYQLSLLLTLVRHWFLCKCEKSS